MTTLFLLFIFPLLASLLLFLLSPLSSRVLKLLAFILSLFPLALLLSRHDSWIGSQVLYNWLPSLHIQFYLKIDPASLLFLYLPSIIIPISILAIHSKKLLSPHVYFGLTLFLQGLLIGFFMARDLVLFTFLWEAMLLPLYFIISLWGGLERRRAALKFLIYMIAGSTLMVTAVLGLYFAGGAHTFSMDALRHTSLAMPYFAIVAAIFMLAFAVKTPLFPFHAWLPDAYYEAPVAGTILLSAVLSKAGIYGFLRIGTEFFPSLMQQWSPLLLTLAIVGVFYGGLAAWMQKDYKRLIAYSSFSHVNFVLVGLFVWSAPAQSGAILQAFNHSITITALFLVAGWLQERLGTTEFGSFGGLAKFLPHLCWLTLFFVLSSVALPGMNNFVGELLILVGLFKHNPWAAAVLTLSVILSVIYMLRWMQKMYFEAPSFFQENWIDIRAKQFAIALPLIFVILWVGIYPTPFLNLSQPPQAQNEVPQ